MGENPSECKQDAVEQGECRKTFRRENEGDWETEKKKKGETEEETERVAARGKKRGTRK